MFVNPEQNLHTFTIPPFVQTNFQAWWIILLPYIELYSKLNCKIGSRVLQSPQSSFDISTMYLVGVGRRQCFCDVNWKTD